MKKIFKKSKYKLWKFIYKKKYLVFKAVTYAFWFLNSILFTKALIWSESVEVCIIYLSFFINIKKKSYFFKRWFVMKGFFFFKLDKDRNYALKFRCNMCNVVHLHIFYLRFYIFIFLSVSISIYCKTLNSLTSALQIFKNPNTSPSKTSSKV